MKAANLRLEQDAVYTHMAGPDSDNPLAYLDYSQVIELIERFWDQIGYALFEKASWQGRQVELKRIRHRIGHMRRPHADDLSWLEQVLGDLEGGTFKALSTYNDRRAPDAAVQRCGDAGLGSRRARACSSARGTCGSSIRDATPGVD